MGYPGKAMERGNVQRTVLLIAGAAILLNAVAYTVIATNPFIDADDWYFLQFVVIPFDGGQFDPRDLFLLRSHADHALPIHKLVMLASAEWFHLDNHFQAFVGIFAGMAAGALLCRRIFETVPVERSRIMALLVAILILSVAFSLNSHKNYSRWLVTLGYLSFCAAVFLFLAVDSALRRQRGSFARVCIATAVALIVADDVGVLSAACAVMVLAIMAALEQRKDLRNAALAVVVVSVGYRMLVYAPLVTYMNAQGPGFLDRAISLGLPDPLQFYKAVTIPFADSLLHRTHFDRLLGNGGQTAHTALGVVIFSLHAGAWWRYLRARAYRISVMPALLAAVSYAAILGVLLGRIPGQSYEYFHALRYVHLYQPGLIGVVWMWFMVPGSSESGAAKTAEQCVTTILVTLLLGAAVLSAVMGWKHVNLLTRQQLSYGALLVQLAEDPGQECPRVYNLCRQFSAESRNNMLTFLRDRELNAFEPGMRVMLEPFQRLWWSTGHAGQRPPGRAPRKSHGSGS